jgi:hypothetical protein
VVAGSQPGTGRHEAVLVPLRIHERLLGRLEDRARVRQGLIEEEPVEFIADVIVRRDVALTPRAGVPSQAVRNDPGELSWDPEPPPSQGERLAFPRGETE